MGDHIEHECRRCGSLLHYEDKCPCKQCGLIHNPEHSCTPAVDLCELCKHPQHAGRCGHMISGSRGGQFDCGHTVPSALKDLRDRLDLGKFVETIMQTCGATGGPTALVLERLVKERDQALIGATYHWCPTCKCCWLEKPGDAEAKRCSCCARAQRLSDAMKDMVPAETVRGWIQKPTRGAIAEALEKVPQWRASDEIPLYREELALEMADAVLKLTQAQGDIGEIKGSAVPPMYRVRMDKFPSGDPNPYWAEDVRKRDEVLFALRDVMRWADPHAVPGCDKNVETHEKAKELLTAHCPGCRGRYTETDKHTCVREGT